MTPDEQTDEIMRLFRRESMAPSRIDRALGLRPGTAHDTITAEWLLDKITGAARRARAREDE